MRRLTSGRFSSADGEPPVFDAAGWPRKGKAKWACARHLACSGQRSGASEAPPRLMGHHRRGTRPSLVFRRMISRSARAGDALFCAAIGRCSGRSPQHHGHLRAHIVGRETCPGEPDTMSWNHDRIRVSRISLFTSEIADRKCCITDKPPPSNAW